MYRVAPLVDGVTLMALVETFENARSFHPAGGYGGIAPELFRFGRLDRYLLGDVDDYSYWVSLGGIYLLACECGEVGCWPLQSKVRLTDRQVIWSQFTQPHRPERDY